MVNSGKQIYFFAHRASARPIYVGFNKIPSYLC